MCLWQLLFFQWNGCSFFTMWKIFSCLCCLHAAPYGSWSWFTNACPSRYWNRNFSYSTPNISSPSYVRASHIFPGGGNVKFYPTFTMHLILSCSLIQMNDCLIYQSGFSVYTALVQCLCHVQLELRIVWLQSRSVIFHRIKEHVWCICFHIYRSS